MAAKKQSAIRRIVKTRVGGLLCALTLVALGTGWGWWRLGGNDRGGSSDGAPASAAQGCPTSFRSLLDLAPSQIDRLDIALLNVLSAEGLPGAEDLNPQECIATLDRWAQRVRSETERHLYRFKANPGEFESSEGYFRMLMMAVVVYEDFGVRYNPERVSTPGTLDPNDHFFADSRDVFLHRMLGGKVQSPTPNVQSLTSNAQGRNSPSPYPAHEPQCEQDGPLSAVPN